MKYTLQGLSFFGPQVLPLKTNPGSGSACGSSNPRSSSGQALRVPGLFTSGLPSLSESTNPQSGSGSAFQTMKLSLTVAARRAGHFGSQVNGAVEPAAQLALLALVPLFWARETNPL